MANDWYANGADLSITGKLEIFQQSEYDLSNVDISLKGLIENSGYHIHMVNLTACVWRLSIYNIFIFL